MLKTIFKIRPHDYEYLVVYSRAISGIGQIRYVQSRRAIQPIYRKSYTSLNVYTTMQSIYSEVQNTTSFRSLSQIRLKHQPKDGHDFPKGLSCGLVPKLVGVTIVISCYRAIASVEVLPYRIFARRYYRKETKKEQERNKLHKAVTTHRQHTKKRSALQKYIW